MLETIRQYAREKLLELGEGEEVRKRHFDYYLQKVKQAYQDFFGPRELAWLDWLENEWDNLRVAVEWSLENYPEKGLDLVNCLGSMLFDAVSNVSDIEGWLSQFLSHSENSTRTAQRAQGLLNWSLYAWFAGAGQEDFAPMQARLEEGLAIYEELGDKNGLAHFFFLKAGSAEDTQTGVSYLQQALDLFRETNDKPWIARALLHIGWWDASLEYASRISALQEGLSLYRELGSIPGIVETLKQIGAIEVRLGNFEAAHRRLEEGFSLIQEHALSKTISYDLGDLAFYEGDYELALKFYEDSLVWASQKGLSLSVSWAKVRLAYAYSKRGEEQKARLFFHEALQSFRIAEDTGAMGFIMEGIASLAITQGKYERAVRLLAWADVMHEQIGAPRPPVEQASIERDLAMIHSQIENANFAKLSAEGRAMTVEEALALALED